MWACVYIRRDGKWAITPAEVYGVGTCGYNKQRKRARAYHGAGAALRSLLVKVNDVDETEFRENIKGPRYSVHVTFESEPCTATPEHPIRFHFPAFTKHMQHGFANDLHLRDGEGEGRIFEAARVNRL